MNESLLRKLVIPAQTRIAMIVLDGLGGLPMVRGGKTELETAYTPNLDALAGQSCLGLTLPAGPGITVGSGPGHLALFGYDPMENEIGRGAMEALGADFELGQDDVAARGNFCTLGAGGVITDRRAGRIPTNAAVRLLERLRAIKLEEAQFFLLPVKEHRFAFVMRGEGLDDGLTETDPQQTGVPPLPVRATRRGAEHSVGIANRFIERAGELLRGKEPANMILLRGFARLPKLPTFAELYGLHAACIALHGMYRGVARLAGMEVLVIEGDRIEDEFCTLERRWRDFDFFYLPVKKTDTCGEQGDFAGKVTAIEEVDSLIPRLLKLNPEVVIVCGDHSSPAMLKAHSWHPVPLMIYGRYARPDRIFEFGERACMRGSLGVLPAKAVMPLALANAGRIAKYGA